jgi:hypothetical protein
MLLLKVVLTFCVLTVLAVNAVPLWGYQGHQITASIAQALIDSASTKQVDVFLANVSGQMDQVSSWADDIRYEPGWEWTAPLHYINTPAWACTYDPNTDCPNSMCVAGAIFNYTGILLNSTDYNLQYEALLFLIHFHGDIHQPLHVGFGVDEGGNDIEGTYYDSKYNLHEVWDYAILDTRIKDDFNNNQNDYLTYLLKQINGDWKDNVTQWEQCSGFSCPNEWASESAFAACKYSYTDSEGKHIENGFDLGESYYDFVKTTIDIQLSKGGVRLASTLNKIFAA